MDSKEIKEGPKDYKKEKKPRLELLPLNILQGLSIAYEYGTKKYYKESHRLGFLVSTNLGSALRHISKYKDEGLDYDLEAWEKESIKVHHIDMAIFNLVCVKDAIMNHHELVDNYIPNNYKPVTPLSDNDWERINKAKENQQKLKLDYDKRKEENGK